MPYFCEKTKADIVCFAEESVFEPPAPQTQRKQIVSMKPPNRNHIKVLCFRTLFILDVRHKHTHISSLSRSCVTCFYFSFHLRRSFSPILVSVLIGHRVGAVADENEPYRVYDATLCPWICFLLRRLFHVFFLVRSFHFAELRGVF